jgi:hypothetical protein
MKILAEMANIRNMNQIIAIIDNALYDFERCITDIILYIFVFMIFLVINTLSIFIILVMVRYSSFMNIYYLNLEK